MSKLVLILALAALSFSVTKSASPKKDQSEGMTTMMGVEKKDNQDAMTMFMDTMKTCNESFTIEASYLQSLNESGSFPDETERPPKCYVRCLLEKLGVATEEGVYDPTQMTMLLGMIRPESDSSSLDDITVKCNSRKEACKCERAYQYAKCVIQEEIMKNSS